MSVDSEALIKVVDLSVKGYESVKLVGMQMEDEWESELCVLVDHQLLLRHSPPCQTIFIS